MAGIQSEKSPLARLVLVIICLSVFGSIVAGAHYFAIDLPAQKILQAPVNGDDINTLQVEIQDLRGQLSIKIEQMQKLKEQMEFVNNQVMGLDRVKDRERYSEYEQQIIEYNNQLTILQIEVQNLMSKINSLENLLSNIQKRLEEQRKLELSSVR
jgi:predicted  nucleic acid-binding Zn-ribbon protein